MNYKRILYKKKLLAEVINSGTNVQTTKFFSNKESSFQFGLFAHNKGFEEAPHFHKRITRKISDIQQVLFVQRGEVEIYFYNKIKKIVKKIRIKKGDAINIVSGIHSLKVLKKTQCLTVKQGPFISDKDDKVNV